MIKGNQRFTAPTVEAAVSAANSRERTACQPRRAGGDFNTRGENVKIVTQTDETYSVHDGHGWCWLIHRPETTEYAPEMMVCVSLNPRDIPLLLDYTV
jgi:hypothetical protein